MSRKQCEEQLLSYAVDSHSINFLLGDQIYPSYFKHYYEHAVELFSKFERDGVIPSLDRVRNRIPDFVYSPAPSTDIPDLKYEIKTYHAKSIMQKTLYEVQPLWNTDNWKEAVQKVRVAADEADAVESSHKIMDLAADASQRYNYFVERSMGEEGDAWKFSLAHPQMNEYLGGLEPGDLFVYASRPGIGKSFSALADAINIWRNDVSVLFVSLEMNTNKIGFRFDSEYGHWSSFNLSRGLATNSTEGTPLERGRTADKASADEYMQYIREMEERSKEGSLPSFYTVTPGNAGRTITPSYVNSQAKRLGVSLVVVDYMGLVRADSGDPFEISRLDEVSWSFKESAQQLGIPYIVPHQLNREAEKAKEVTVANFAGSDSIGRNIDIAAHIEKDREYVYYDMIKVRGGPGDAKFGWYWDYDSATKKIIDPSQIELPEVEDEGSIGNFVPGSNEEDQDDF